MAKVRELLVGKQAANRVADERRKETFLEAGDTVTAEVLSRDPDAALARRAGHRRAPAQDQVDRIFASIDEQAA